MGKSINRLAVARFSVNVTVYITVYITVSVAAPQHAACQRQPIYELLSPVAYPPPLHYAMLYSARPPKRGTVTCNHCLPLLRPLSHIEKQRGVILYGQLLSLKTAATYSPTNAVPSARSGLTSLFGMGRGGTPTL